MFEIGSDRTTVLRFMVKIDKEYMHIYTLTSARDRYSKKGFGESERARERDRND